MLPIRKKHECEIDPRVDEAVGKALEAERELRQEICRNGAGKALAKAAANIIGEGRPFPLRPVNPGVS